MHRFIFSVLLVGFSVLPTNVWGANGPLKVSTVNPRYFADQDGAIVYLIGSHTWNNFQNWSANQYPPQEFNYTEYLDFLVARNHNFFRLWTWEQRRYMPHRTANDWFAPSVYKTVSGTTAIDGQPKFDTTKFNQAYFDRLRQHVIDAGNRDIYTSIMLFQGWGIDWKGYSHSNRNPWNGHPYNSGNNVNGVNGDTNGDGEGSEIHSIPTAQIRSLQEAYIRKVIDILNDLDNVLYEISNESDGCRHGGSSTWQYDMINYIKGYEASKPNSTPSV